MIGLGTESYPSNSNKLVLGLGAILNQLVLGLVLLMDDLDGRSGSLDGIGAARTFLSSDQDQSETFNPNLKTSTRELL